MNKPLLRVAALALMGVGSLAFSGSASAYCAPHRRPTPARYDHQNQRIHQGVRSGELTRRETRDLRHDERGMRREARHDRWENGGHLTSDERKDLRHDLNHQSKEIYAYKHNGPDRWWAK